jgi:hypothetical protein
MRILLLEDSQERIEWFKRIYKYHELIVCSNIFDAENVVQFEEIDIFFLDHDLEPNNLEGIAKLNTGYDFVKFVINQELQKKAIYYIHSMNATGANQMLNLLKDNGYETLWVPFHLLKLGDR